MLKFNLLKTFNVVDSLLEIGRQLRRIADALDRAVPPIIPRSGSPSPGNLIHGDEETLWAREQKERAEAQDQSELQPTSR